MKVRHEVRRLVRSLGEEIRRNLDYHDCSKTMTPLGCALCVLPRNPDTVLAALAYARVKFKIQASQNVYPSENELIELIGRDKVISKTKHQLTLMKTCFRKICQNCGTEFAVPFNSHTLSIYLKVSQRDYVKKGFNALSAPCNRCGNSITVSEKELPEVNLENVTAFKSVYNKSEVRRYFILVSQNTQNHNIAVNENEEDGLEDTEETDNRL